MIKYYIKMYRNEPFACIHLLSKTGICFMLNENRFRVGLYDTEDQAHRALEKAKARYGNRFDVYQVLKG